MANNGSTPPPSDYGPDKDSVAVITVQTPLHCVCMCVCTDVCGSGGRRHCSISSCVSRTSLLYEEHVCVCMCGGGGPGGSFCAAFPLLSSGHMDLFVLCRFMYESVVNAHSLCVCVCVLVSHTERARERPVVISLAPLSFCTYSACVCVYCMCVQV